MESEPAKLFVPFPDGKGAMPKMYKLYGRKIILFKFPEGTI